MNNLDYIYKTEIVSKLTRRECLVNTIANMYLLGYSLPENWSGEYLGHKYGMFGCTRVSLGFYPEEFGVPTHLELHYWYGEDMSNDIYLNEGKDVQNGGDVPISFLEDILRSLIFVE